MSIFKDGDIVIVKMNNTNRDLRWLPNMDSWIGCVAKVRENGVTPGRVRLLRIGDEVSFWFNDESLELAPPELALQYLLDESLGVKK